MLLQCQWTVKRRWDPNHVLRAQQRDIHRRDCCQLHICSLGASTPPAPFDRTPVRLLGKGHWLVWGGVNAKSKSRRIKEANSGTPEKLRS